MSDIEIARQADKRNIVQLARDKLGIDGNALEPCHYEAKLKLDYIESLRGRADGKLILVTGISPTPPDESKITAPTPRWILLRSTHPTASYPFLPRVSTEAPHALGSA
jgi:Formate--tetrahydrofolate ligase